MTRFSQWKKLKLFPLLLALVLALSACQGALPGDWSQAAGAVSLDDIPTYSGDAYIAVNDNQPFFTQDELTTEAFETYSELDELGRCGVDADVIGVEESLDRYKVVVLPMLYMVKPGFGEKIRQFVANGGTVIGTYLLGYVNDSTLAWLGGFPGDGLREVFGVTATELDTLYPGERNTAAFPDGSKAAIQDYCELLETADNTDVLATYGEDFYKGYAVATHHAFGKGHAYYVAARMDADGNAKVFRAAMAQAGCTMQTLPDGVEYHCREDERAVYHFYLNTTETDKTVAVPIGADLLTGKTVSGEVTLGRYGACAVEVVK